MKAIVTITIRQEYEAYCNLIPFFIVKHIDMNELIKLYDSKIEGYLRKAFKNKNELPIVFRRDGTFNHQVQCFRIS